MAGPLGENPTCEPPGEPAGRGLGAPNGALHANETPVAHAMRIADSAVKVPARDLVVDTSPSGHELYLSCLPPL